MSALGSICSDRSAEQVRLSCGGALGRGGGRTVASLPPVPAGVIAVQGHGLAGLGCVWGGSHGRRGSPAPQGWAPPGTDHSSPSR